MPLFPQSQCTFCKPVSFFESLLFHSVDVSVFLLESLRYSFTVSVTEWHSLLTGHGYEENLVS